MSTSATAGSAVNPNQPVVNLGNLYVNGMNLTYLTATTMTVGAGQCRDSTDSVDIIMGGNQYSSTSNPGGEQGLNNPVTASSAVTINTALTGAGGVDIGGGTLITASRMYAVFAIADSRGFNAGSAMLVLEPLTATSTVSTSAVPSMPLGYDCYRYIGSVSMDSSKNIRAFQQTGSGLARTMWYDSGTLDATHIGLAIPSSATAASQTLATIGVLSTIVPQKAIEVMVYGSLVANAAGDSLLLTPKGFVGPATGFRTNASGTVVGQVMRVPCNFNAGTPNIVEIDYATSSATATVAFTLPGYVDQL
jgi:hypothetical protein